jgi:hypothetical protein
VGKGTGREATGDVPTTTIRTWEWWAHCRTHPRPAVLPTLPAFDGASVQP